MVYYVLKRFSSSSREHNLSFLFFTLLNGLGGSIYLIYRLLTDPARIAIPTKPFSGVKQVITYDLFENGAITPLSQLGRTYHVVPFLLGFVVLYLFCTRDYRKVRNILLTGIFWGATILFGGPIFAFGSGIILCLYAFSRCDMKAVKSLLAIMFMGIPFFVPWYCYLTGNKFLFNLYVSGGHHVMPWAIIISVGPHVATSLYYVCTKLELRDKELSLREKTAILLSMGCLVFIVFYGFAFVRDLGNLKYQYLSFLPALILAAYLIAPRLDAPKTLKRLRSEEDFTFLCLWAFTIFVSSIWYGRFAFWFPARQLFFLWLPIAILSAKGVTNLIEKYDASGSRKLLKRIVVVFIILTFPSFIFYNVFFAYRWTQGASNKLLYTTIEDFQAMQFLTTQASGRVLSAPETGGYLPFYTNHGALLYDRKPWVIDIEIKKEETVRFYQGRMAQEEMREFLDRRALVYVFYGANEKELSEGKLRLENVSFLEQIYNSGGTKIFRFGS